MGTSTCTLGLIVLSTAVLAFPTANHEQIVVHHTPMHDVVYIPEYMMGNMVPQPRRQMLVRAQDLEQEHLRHQEPQKICLQQISPDQQHQIEEIHHPSPVQQQPHVVLNPNHAIYMSTLDEFGNLRTFKISQNSPLLRQTMLTAGQEAPEQQEQAISADQKQIEDNINAGDVTDQTETPKNVEVVDAEETQIESPEEKENKENSSVEKIEEVTPKEDTKEESKEVKEEELPKKNDNEEEKIIIVEPTVDQNEEIFKTNQELENLNESLEVLLEKNDKSDEKNVNEHDHLSKLSEDEEKHNSGEHHDIEKRDVENVSSESDIIKKDLSETTSEEMNNEKKAESEEQGSFLGSILSKVAEKINSSINTTEKSEHDKTATPSETVEKEIHESSSEKKEEIVHEAVQAVPTDVEDISENTNKTELVEPIIEISEPKVNEQMVGKEIENKSEEQDKPEPIIKQLVASAKQVKPAETKLEAKKDDKSSEEFMPTATPAPTVTPAPTATPAPKIAPESNVTPLPNIDPVLVTPVAVVPTTPSPLPALLNSKSKLEA